MAQCVCVTVVCPWLCCASVVLVCVHGTVVSPLHCCMSLALLEFVALSFFCSFVVDPRYILCVHGTATVCVPGALASWHCCVSMTLWCVHCTILCLWRCHFSVALLLIRGHIVCPWRCCVSLVRLCVSGWGPWYCCVSVAELCVCRALFCACGIVLCFMCPWHCCQC